MSIVFEVLLTSAIVALIVWPETATAINEVAMRGIVWFKNVKARIKEKE